MFDKKTVAFIIVYFLIQTIWFCMQIAKYVFMMEF